MKHYFIIGGNGKEYGPVSESEVYEWIKEGRANGQAPIRPAGHVSIVARVVARHHDRAVGCFHRPWVVMGGKDGTTSYGSVLEISPARPKVSRVARARGLDVQEHVPLRQHQARILVIQKCRSWWLGRE